MGDIIQFDFSSDKIKEIIEKTKKKTIQSCQDCGHKFKEDSYKMEGDRVVIFCPKCKSKNVKVELGR